MKEWDEVARRKSRGVRRASSLCFGLSALLLLLGARAWGQVIKQEDGSPLGLLVVSAARPTPPSSEDVFEDAKATLAQATTSAWDAFAARHGNAWQAYVDPRTGQISSVEGVGAPWIPGGGNRLTAAATAAKLGPHGKPTLATLEGIARGFVQENADLLGTAGDDLVLSPGRSGQVAPHLWYVDFDVVRGGLVIEGARIFFRVNNGNLIQFGRELVPPGGTRVPSARWSRDKAFAVLSTYVGGIDPAFDEIVDAGSLHLLPIVSASEANGFGYQPGSGLELVVVWQFVFRRPGVLGTFRGRVDAETGELYDFSDVNDYAAAKVTGGAYAGDRPTAEAVWPMPFADVSSGGFTNSAGIYDYPGGTVTSTLNGQYVKIVDTCGAISRSATIAPGDIALGTSAGTDCTTPGVGGAGNTHASRTQFYAVDRAKEVGRGWLPTNTWLSQQLTVNVNIVDTCNAYWNGSTLNFFRSGGGCANTGELPGVSLHEWGHGMDSNDGNGGSPENGTGETYGDFSGALFTHSSCLGAGFLGGNCGGYGDACTSCTGVRDIDWAKHTSNTAHTVANFTDGVCPAPSVLNPTYVGPCGADAWAKGGNRTARREGHCESYVSSEALWDFANRDLPSPGSGAAWAITERLWYLSRSTTGSDFVCNTTPATWTSSGCAPGSLWRTMRAADDDDGNLTNGTPHSCNLYAALNRHLIACTTDAAANTCFSGCTPPATPTLTVSPGTNRTYLEWTSSGDGIVYDVYRGENGCNAGTIRIAAALSGTSYTDNAVANGLPYVYRVVAYPSGNGACAAAPTACVSSVTPCTSLAAPGGMGASGTGANEITVTWSTVAGASGYRLYRSLTTGGPYALVASPGAGATSYADNTVSGGVSYFYVVRSVSAAGCVSDNSTEVSASATGTCSQAPSFAGATSVVSAGAATCGLTISWSAGTARCGGPIGYSVYRSTAAGFTPGAANRIASGLTGTSYADTGSLANGTTYYYVVRALDQANGVEESNLIVRSGTPFGVGSSTSLYSESFDGGSCTGLCGWTTVALLGTTTNWPGVQTCTAQSGLKIFRFGGADCTSGAYDINRSSYARPPGISVPAGTTSVQLSFYHRWNFEPSWDGGYLELSVDNLHYAQVPASAMTSGAYNGTTGSGTPAWTGTQAGFVNTVASLDSVCASLTGGGTCGGRTIYVAFVAWSDETITDLGWYLDTVSVTGSVPAACSGGASPVRFLTASGKSEQVTLEWLTPATTPFSATRLRFSSAGFPTDPTTSGALVADVAGSVDSKSSTVHSTGVGTNGTVEYYSGFANNGAGAYSNRTSVSGLPIDVSGRWKWNFATSAAALAPPIQGWGIALFVPSNDRALYATTLGSAGGTWPVAWRPGAMNGPAQSQPLVMLSAQTGLAFDAVFVGSQDGYVYCFNASTGAGCAGWPAGGRGVENLGMVQASPMLHTGTPKLLLVGTRNSTGANSLAAINLANGTTAWKFTNSGAQNGDDKQIGIVSSPVLLDSANSLAYFTSRVRSGGSTNTVWRIDFSSGSPTLAWGRAIGDVDAAVTQDWTNNRLLVGTVGGAVYWLNPTNGNDALTSRSLANGAIKSFIYYDPGQSPARLYLATDTKVWGIRADGSSVGDWVATLEAPTRPLLHYGTSQVYVGACKDATCTDGRLIELDAANSWATPKTYDLAGTGGLGPVTIDRTQSPALLHAGSRSGRVVAVQVPLP